jgi:hypothetical protein
LTTRGDRGQRDRDTAVWLERLHSYKGRDPRTGAAVAVKPKRLPFFRANYKLKELLNPSVTRTQDLPAVPEDRQHGQPRAGLRTA